MSKMRVVQVTRANGPLEIVEREITEPARVRCVLKSRLAAYATAIPSPRKEPGRPSSAAIRTKLLRNIESGK